MRPGGRIVLEGDDHDLLRLSPEPPGFATVWGWTINAVTSTWATIRSSAGDWLASLVEAGAVPLQRNSLVFLGSCAGEPHFGHYIDNLIGVIDGARATVVDATLLDATAFDAAILVSCPASSLAFGRRCIPPGGVARCSHIGQDARASRLANRAPRRPRCTPNFRDATLALRDRQRGPSATLWYAVSWAEGRRRD